MIALTALACVPTKDGAKLDTTTTLQAIDTLKVAVDTLPTRDTVATAPAQTKTPVTGTKTKTVPTTKAQRDSIIGYDKVTPLDPNKKRLDTVKKRPPG